MLRIERFALRGMGMYVVAACVLSLVLASAYAQDDALDGLIGPGSGVVTAVTEAEPTLAEVVATNRANSDLIWLMTATALVMLMQAGFALLEGGMTRSKNSVNVLMKNYTDMAFGSIAFFVVGFGLMFGANPTGFIGTSHFAPGAAQGMTGYDYGFLIFQLMFAATAATIVSGAMAERTKYWSYIIMSILITGVIYPIFGSWCWGGAFGGAAGKGWLSNLGFIDFAGSTVVHSVGGWAALAGVMVLGPRTGRFGRDGSVREIPGHSLMMVALGGFILWFGWFGFNAGSNLAGAPILGTIMLNTQMAACAGVVGAIVYLKATGRAVLLTASINGGLGGLVGITAGCASMDPLFAIITGILAGALSIAAADLMLKLKLDDVVGAVAVHGFCGAFGTICAGAFVAGDLFNLHQIGIQALGVASCFVFTFGTVYCGFRVINAVIGLRASTLHEQRGLDFTEHAEVGYPEFEEGLMAQEQA